MMENVLVTGAGGYIGTTLVPILLQRDFRVRAIDRFFFGEELLPDHPNLELIKEDSRQIKKAHFDGIDGVIDLVAISNDACGETFEKPTWEINWASRVRTATMAKEAGVERYVLPSSCSIYGFQASDYIADENSPTNPLSTYAKANEKAEQGVLPLADDKFHVMVLRQATVYGYSPRMRFDLAINGMTYGAWHAGKLPTMRDGTQWRPMIHVRDAAEAQMLMLIMDPAMISGQIFNVASDVNNYQIGPLADIIAANVSRDVEIEWYGDPDERSYRVSSQKIERLGYRAKHRAEDGVREICEALESGKLDKSIKTITLEWYKRLEKWHKIICQVELHNGILEITDSLER